MHGSETMHIDHREHHCLSRQVVFLVYRIQSCFSSIIIFQKTVKVGSHGMNTKWSRRKTMMSTNNVSLAVNMVIFQKTSLVPIGRGQRELFVNFISDLYYKTIAFQFIFLDTFFLFLFYAFI